MMLDIIRYAVFGALAASGVIALSSWAVRTRRLSSFGRPAALIRRATDPVLRPIEHWLLQRGGNPQHAEGWLFVGTVVGGIGVVAVATVTADVIASIVATAGRPYGLVRTLVLLAGRAVSLAIIVRVIGSWVGFGRYRPFMRPFYWVTDWIVEPLRRFIPPIGGAIDVTPWIAFILVQVVVSLLV